MIFIRYYDLIEFYNNTYHKISQGAQPGKLYVMVKTHKNSHPVRPVLIAKK